MSGPIAPASFPGSTGPTEADRQPLRLLHVTTVAMSLLFLRGQVKHMQGNGFRVHALCSPGPELQAFGRRYGIPVFGVEMPRRITPLRDLVAVARIVGAIRRVKPHVVHAHTPKGGLLGMIAATLARVPVRVYHMRGLPMTAASGPKRLLLRWTERLSCTLAHRVLCVSHQLRQTAIAAGLCPADKIAVVAGGSGQGVDASGTYDPERVGEQAREEVRSRLFIPAGATVIGFVGRLVRDKGIVELASAWRALRDAHPDAHLLLVGPWEPQDPVPAEVVAGLEADSRVHLVGEDWNTPPYYAAMDLLVLPTYREGFPNVPLEAAAMRLPVVATTIPGCQEAVADGETGTLVPVGDAAALEAAIRSYLQDPALRRRHGDAGRARVLRNFRQEVFAEAILAEYLRLLGDAGIALHPDAPPLTAAVAGSHPGAKGLPGTSAAGRSGRPREPLIAARPEDPAPHP